MEGSWPACADRASGSNGEIGVPALQRALAQAFLRLERPGSNDESHVRRRFPGNNKGPSENQATHGQRQKNWVGSPTPPPGTQAPPTCATSTPTPRKETTPATLGLVPMLPLCGLWEEPLPKPVVRRLLGGASVPLHREALVDLDIGRPVQGALLAKDVRLDLLHLHPRMGHDLGVRVCPAPLREHRRIAPRGLRHVSRLLAASGGLDVKARGREGRPGLRVPGRCVA